MFNKNIKNSEWFIEKWDLFENFVIENSLKIEKCKLKIKKIPMIEKRTFFVRGMHCKACPVLVESEVGELPGVASVRADLGKQCVEISGEFEGKREEDIVKEVNAVLKPHGYRISNEKSVETKKWSEFVWAAPIALGILALFIILQKIGIVDRLHAVEVTYGTAFLIGIVASLSTCMAVVGGLVLSMSATFAKEGDKIKPQILFHGGRILSFFIFGGVIGAVGSAFTLTSFTTFLLSMIVGVVMLLLGVNLLDVVPWTRKMQLGMPKFIAKRVQSVAKWNHSLTPFLVGGVTFFLPCGFTQSMQIFALSTGSFWQGAMTLLAFALGTLPVLLVLSFGSLGIKPSGSGIFFKTAGLVVIAFAVFNLWSGLAAMGFVEPVF